MSTEPADGAGDVAVTDRQLFDNAIEPTPAPAPEPPAAEPPSGEPAAAAPEGAAPTAQPRDDQGRFAAKAPQAPPAATAAPTAPQAPPGPPPQDHRVPLRELLDERERRQKIEAEANQLRQAWQQFHAMQQQQAMAAQQQQMPQTIYDNPEQYLIQNVIEPIRQEGRMEFLRIKDEWSREQAEDRHGAETVQAALNDLARIRRTPHGDYVFNQIMSQRHPYGALVKWHAQAKMQQQIGPDPNAWLQKQQEAWLDDPKVQAKVVERIQAAQKGSNRPPTVNLPPSLSSMPAAGGDEQGDLSDASLYRFATR